LGFSQTIHWSVHGEEGALHQILVPVTLGTLDQNANSQHACTFVIFKILTICSGVNSNGTVCGGHGTCIALDTCSCRYGYGTRDCSVMNSGYVYSIGSNTVGQLGDDYYNNQVYRTMSWYPLSYSRYIQQIATGADCTFAITTAGDLFTWGDNSITNYYKLGLGSSYTPTTIRVPAQLKAGTKFVSISASLYHVAAVDTYVNHYLLFTIFLVLVLYTLGE
jgi:hypothetical protein